MKLLQLFKCINKLLVYVLLMWQCPHLLRCLHVHLGSDLEPHLFLVASEREILSISKAISHWGQQVFLSTKRLGIPYRGWGFINIIRAAVHIASMFVAWPNLFLTGSNSPINLFSIKTLLLPTSVYSPGALMAYCRGAVPPVLLHFSSHQLEPAWSMVAGLFIEL